MPQDGGGGDVAVLDVGKTNIKLSAVSAHGDVLETLTAANSTQDGPLWRRHDLKALGTWVFSNLSDLCKRYRIGAFVCSGHGSGGVLTAVDPDEGGDGTVLPMIDYEQPTPDDVDRDYRLLSGSFFDRGSAIMHAATHQARQLYWMQRAAPNAFARARWFLGVPQYWAWRISGVAVSEKTYLGAQSHLWNVPEARWAPIVSQLGWADLMPPFAPAWKRIGKVRHDLARRFDLPDDLDILAGIHDSSANLYRYQAAGLPYATVVSTGTWIVALSGGCDLFRLDESRGMTCNSDVDGRPVGGALTMGGREFSLIAGPDAGDCAVSAETVAGLVQRRVMALPSFGGDHGLFPGTARSGRIIGHAATPDEKKALAVLYAALLTNECLDALGSTGTVILDGAFVKEPLYAALVAALGRNRRTRFNLDTRGVAAGAALLAGHENRTAAVPIELQAPPPLGALTEELGPYAREWQRLASGNLSQNLQKGA